MGRNVLVSNPKGIYMSNVVICIYGIIGLELKVNSIVYVYDQVLINMSPQIFKPLWRWDMVFLSRVTCQFWNCSATRQHALHGAETSARSQGHDVFVPNIKQGRTPEQSWEFLQSNFTQLKCHVVGKLIWPMNWDLHLCNASRKV